MKIELKNQEIQERNIFFFSIMYCSAVHCESGSKKVPKTDAKVTFHRFPMKNPILLRKWVKAVKRLQWYPSPQSTLCCKHFKPEDFIVQPGLDKPRARLKHNAVPTIFNYPEFVLRVIRKRKLERNQRREARLFSKSTVSGGEVELSSPVIVSTRTVETDHNYSEVFKPKSIDEETQRNLALNRSLKEKIKELEATVRSQNKEIDRLNSLLEILVKKQLNKVKL